MKFAVIITNVERVSYEEVKDIHYTKLFKDTDSLKDIMNWANEIRKNEHSGSKKADITDLKFSHFCE